MYALERIASIAFGIFLCALVSGAAQAGVDTLQPITGPGIWKTPPLQESDSVQVPLVMHFNNSHQNWAGVGFSINWDSHEVNFVGIAPAPGWTLSDRGFFSPGTSGSTPGFYLPTLWHPNAVGSGIPTSPSSNTTIGALFFHVHGSNASTQNSDTDIDFLDFLGNTLPSPFNIFHATSASILLTFGASDLLYVPVSSPFPSAWQPLAPGSGTWIHLTDTTMLAQQQSAFYGKFSTLAAVGGIGVEHVPEPTSGVLLLGGLTLLVAARRLGARRR